jgi:hypothetical protein
MQQRSNEIALYRPGKIVLPTQSPLTFFPLQQHAGLTICCGTGISVRRDMSSFIKSAKRGAAGSTA